MPAQPLGNATALGDPLPGEWGLGQTQREGEGVRAGLPAFGHN